MKHLIWAIQPYRADIRLLGNCDLVVDAASANPPAGLALKVSGNSLRVCRRWMLYHGTLLLDMQLDFVGQLLKHPPRKPEYRAGRTRANFLANLGIEAGTLRDSLPSMASRCNACRTTLGTHKWLSNVTASVRGISGAEPPGNLGCPSSSSSIHSSGWTDG